jgi:hypothetical protein
MKVSSNQDVHKPQQLARSGSDSSIGYSDALNTATPVFVATGSTAELWELELQPNKNRFRLCVSLAFQITMTAAKPDYTVI